MTTMSVHGLIPAAGSGERFGNQLPKQYQLIAGKAVLAHSIEALLQHPLVNDVTVVLSPDDQHFSLVEDNLSSSVQTVTGGATRAQSVLNGLLKLSTAHPDTDWVLVHDAARPCLSQECLNLLLHEGMQGADGAILALPVSDTLKQSNANQEIVATVKRDQLWAAQTPQLFQLGVLRSAMQDAMEKGRPLTDEASAVEYAGGVPRLVMGSSENIKITWPGDLAVASGFLVENKAGVTTGAGTK
jgi:2-C-methyl-D-erythritol 4-phosphate cytidylyltransferase